MMCINTYSLVKRVCVGHALYILSVLDSGHSTGYVDTVTLTEWNLSHTVQYN
jgi:hypothetical protein